MEDWELAAEYHRQTKHYFDRFARSLGYMDWANQPSPFRRYESAPIHPLLIEAVDSGPAYDSIFDFVSVASQPVDVHSISAFFQFSMAISAWKEYRGSRWALRVNPSSGNLHPTESYLIAGPIDGLMEAPGVFHYAPAEHVLEQRAELDAPLWREAIAGFPEGSFLVGLTSILWREVWKYGERGFRYCQHDVGHAFAAMTFSAAHLGWQIRWLDALGDEDVSSMLGLDRESDYANAEREHPDLIGVVFPASSNPKRVPRGIPTSAVARSVEASWFGKANQLSGEHVDWEWIKSASEVCVKPRLETESRIIESIGDQRMTADQCRTSNSALSVPARRIFVQRRSGAAFDGATSITSARFFEMLKRVMPQQRCAPWSAMSAGTVPIPREKFYVHLLLFVHRVEGLGPGLYFLFRGLAKDHEFEAIRGQFREDFLWQRPANCPENLALFALQLGDARKLAAQVSCGQEIASDGCFAVSMVAEFERPLRELGAWFYRRLHWETGMIGQMLYLEAEVAGVRATGIGCFFDDPVHDLLGLEGMTYQDLYHFTIGGAVDDDRLTTLPPYGQEIVNRRPSD